MTASAHIKAGRRTAARQSAPQPPQTRSASEFASAERHSRRVRLIKLALPLAALFGIGFFSAATFLVSADTAPPPASPVTMNDGRIVMAKPKLEGFTADKRPYKMTAERAIQDSAKANVVELQQITADLPFGRDATATLTADAGLLDNVSSLLELTDNIKLVTSDGMTVKLSAAKIDIAKNSVSSDKPVDIDMDGSHLTAESMQIMDGGKIMKFERKVRMNIAKAKLDKASASLSSNQ
jgi:lipopolysaccharide export system protein LptC